MAQIKLAQISKDFNLKTKELTDIFKEVGFDKKTGAVVEDEEFEIFLSHMTRKNQIHDIESYTSGKNTISVVKDKAEEKKPEAKPEEPKEVKMEAPKEEKKEAPKEEKKEALREIKKESAAPAFEKKEERAARAPEQPRAERPRQERDASADKNRRYDNQGSQQRSNDKNFYAPKPQYPKYTERPQNDPFAKKRENMNRPFDQRRPMQNGQPPQMQKREPVQVAKEIKPAAPQIQKQPSDLRPAQKAQLEKQERLQRQQAEPKQAAPVQKKEEKKAQKQQFKKITPTIDYSNVKGGVNINSEYNVEAPKTRIVDMRTSDVNLSKYDDRYNEHFFNIANGGDTKAQKQKLKKQDNRGQNAKSAKDKERAAQEKIKKLEAERARNKQLEITVPDEITVSELAARLKKTSAEVIKKLMLMGEMKGLNDVIDYETAELISDEFGAKVTREVVVTIEEKLFTEAEDNEEDLVERAPVVCVMGHVDHGKTSILDAIRHTNVTKGEAGGITQAIGAYRVKAKGKDITVLDTPGHEAFTAMRMRGAKSTDIAILVVAADDGVMPQTIEAINHAKAAGIDIIVAINKMDKPQANPDNVLNQLTQYELVPEAWGGDVICVPVSALTGMGIDDLLENVLLVAEVKELKANPNRRAKGLVIESKLDRGRGPVATVLVQSGTLHQGDYVIVGNAVGRVRVMVDDKGKTIKTAGPSIPVEIVGLDDVPQAGDELNAVEDERMARSLAEQRREKQRQEILAANSRVNLDDLFNQIADGVKTLNIIVKADVAGSAEAVKASLVKLSNEEVKVTVIHSAVGGITESDVMLAAASNAIITGFNVRPDKNAIDSAERNGVDIRTHRIIYEIIDEVEAAMKGLLAPVFKENLLGHAEVRQTIRVPNVGTIAGSYILDGKITRAAQIRVVRDGIVIFEDKISSLRRFKDDVKEVNEGYECGVGLEKFNDIKEGDVLEAFIMEEVQR